MTLPVLIDELGGAAIDREAHRLLRREVVALLEDVAGRLAVRADALVHLEARLWQLRQLVRSYQSQITVAPAGTSIVTLR